MILVKVVMNEMEMKRALTRLAYEIIEHHKDDNVAVTDFHNRTVVSLKHMKKITA